MKLLRGLMRITVIGLTIIGAITVMRFALQKSRSTAEYKPDYVHSFPSPDGLYRADLLMWAGGGGLSPYCNEALLVSPGSVEVKRTDWNARDEVYSGECGGFRDGRSSPAITWMPGNVLHVSLSINYTAMSPATVKLKKWGASGNVRVEFDVHE